MYKKKYVEFSNMVEKVNNTMALYVVMSAQLEAALYRNRDEGVKRAQKTSIMDQLKELDAQPRQSTKIVTETVEEVYSTTSSKKDYF